MHQQKTRIRGTRVALPRRRETGPGVTVIGDAATFSKIGTRQANEDSCAFWWAGDTLFAAIADGLGGMGGGAHASNYVVDFMRTHALRPDMGVGELVELVRASHRGLQALQQQNVEERSMATTLVVMGLRAGELVAAHCGDSRLYVVTPESAEQLTEDHSEAQRLYNEGKLTVVGLSSYPRKYILESAIGIPGMPVIQAIQRSVAPDDWLVLATDGAYGLLEPYDLADVARASRTPKQFSAACLELIETRGPRDNYTMVVARAGGHRLLRGLKRMLHRPPTGGNTSHAA